MEVVVGVARDDGGRGQEATVGVEKEVVVGVAGSGRRWQAVTMARTENSGGQGLEKVGVEEVMVRVTGNNRRSGQGGGGGRGRRGQWA